MMKAPLVKTRDSTRRRYIVRSRRHVNRRAYIRRHPGGDSPQPQDRRGGVRVRGAPFMSAQRSRLLAQVVAHRRRRPSVGRGRHSASTRRSNRHLCRRYSSSRPTDASPLPSGGSPLHASCSSCSSCLCLAPSARHSFVPAPPSPPVASSLVPLASARSLASRTSLPLLTYLLTAPRYNGAMADELTRQATWAGMPPVAQRALRATRAAPRTCLFW